MLSDLWAVWPELVLALVAVGLFLARGLVIAHGLVAHVHWGTVGLVLVLGLVVASTGGVTRTLFGGALIEDAFTRVAQAGVLFAAGVALAVGVDAMQRHGDLMPDFPALSSLAVLGMVLASAAGEVVTLYLALELMALSFYTLLALRRTSGRASEAALTGALVGLMGSALVLFGLALTAALTGQTGFEAIADALEDPAPVLVSLAMALVVAGLACKIALAPFHLWWPALLDSAPLAVVALMVTGLPLVGLTVLARLMLTVYPALIDTWQPVLGGIAILTVLSGSLIAIAERRVRRVLAGWSCIGTGFALLALSSGTAEGVAAMLAQMMVHATVMAGLVAFLSTLERDGRSLRNVEGLNMYAVMQPRRAFAVLVLCLSACAAPPLVGVLVRVDVLSAVFEAGLPWLAIAGVLASLPAAWAFLRPVRRIYAADEQAGTDTVPARVPFAVLAVTAVAMVLGILDFMGLTTAFETAGARLAR
ncbi:MAG: proton-conducting transporter membrane subunit [Pseudomonadota bacterium]